MKRVVFFKEISQFLGTKLIKVVTGMRRSGKSTFLRQLRDRMRSEGKSVIYIDKESLEFDEIRTYTDLDRYVKARLPGDAAQTLLIIDEVQEIAGWEKAVTSFNTEGKVDLVISGSNAHLLSSEFATLLSGRYIPIAMYPLSFSEFISFRQAAQDSRSQDDLFKAFMRYGGLPGLNELPFTDEALFAYLAAVVDSIFIRDIVRRYQVRDVALLDRVFKYILDTIGTPVSARNISGFLKSQKVKTSTDTVIDYLHHMESSFLVYRCPRYHIKGRRHLEIGDKYYVGDLGLRQGLSGYQDRDSGRLLENIIYLELRRRGYSVSTGMQDGKEIDFVAERKGERIYIQVAYLLPDKEALDREFGNLLRIDDNHPKYVLTLDPNAPANIEGIIHRNLVDFLLNR